LMMEHRTTISIPALSSLDLAFQSLPICRSRARFRAPLPRDLAPRDSGSRVPVEGWRFWWSEKRQWREKERERERERSLCSNSLAASLAVERERESIGRRGRRGGASRATTTSASFLRLPRLQTSLLRALNSHGGSKTTSNNKTPFPALDRPLLRVQPHSRLGILLCGQGGRRRSRGRRRQRGFFLFGQARSRPPRRRRGRVGVRQVLRQPDPAARRGRDQGGMGEGELGGVFFFGCSFSHFFESSFSFSPLSSSFLVSLSNVLSLKRSLSNILSLSPPPFSCRRPPPAGDPSATPASSTCRGAYGT